MIRFRTLVAVGLFGLLGVTAGVMGAERETPSFPCCSYCEHQVMLAGVQW
jgi:hypothetical protein